ncbi:MULTISPECIES: hypothetical protein [unclassified Kitasatospora]
MTPAPAGRCSRALSGKISRTGPGGAEREAEHLPAADHDVYDREEQR